VIAAEPTRVLLLHRRPAAAAGQARGDGGAVAADPA
jgi:hypothetical protein